MNNSISQKTDSSFLFACILFMCAITEGIRQALAGYFTLILFAFLLLFARYSVNILRSCDRYQLSYLFLMLIGFFSHVFIGVEQNAFKEFVTWSLIIIILSLYNRYIRLGSNTALMILLLSFYLIECSLSFYERVVGNIIISYEETDFMSIDEFMEDSDRFRSCALLFHPLLNANVVSIFMGFILVIKKISKPVKIGLLCLGALALWGFNSRGVLLVWGVILVFWFFYRRWSLRFILIVAILGFVLLPMIVDVLIKYDLLGRFGADLLDESSETRLLAFVVFATHNWNIINILFGGDIIYMPTLFYGKELAIENGILLTLGYWGWIIGALKVFLEVLVSYRCLEAYKVKEKLIVMMAFWGVAFTNNNSFRPEALAFYILAYMFSDNWEHFRLSNQVKKRKTN